MKYMLLGIGLLVLLAVVALVVMIRSDGILDEEEAIAIAREAGGRDLKIPTDCPVEVRLQAGHYIVTFVYVSFDPDVLGPDYYAEVTIDSHSGEVVRIAGPN